MHRLAEWLSKSPEWRTLRLLNVITALSMLIFALAMPVSAWSLSCMFCAGFMLSSALHAHMQHVMAEHHAALIASIEHASEIIGRLLLERQEAVLPEHIGPPLQPTTRH